jgi:hypothetical protein
MRHKAGGRKAGERRPVLSSAGIRAGANTVVQESPVKLISSKDII